MDKQGKQIERMLVALDTYPGYAVRSGGVVTQFAIGVLDVLGSSKGTLGKLTALYKLRDTLEAEIANLLSPLLTEEPKPATGDVT